MIDDNTEMKRQECIDKITVAAGRFVEEVKGFNAIGHYSINVHAESFLIPVFNSVFNLQLENVNYTEKRNFPAIDLLDKKNRVAFQITSTSDFSKIKSTLELFFEHNLHEQIDTLYIYILTDKENKYSDQKLSNIIREGFHFTTKQNILDKNDLLGRINAISSTPILLQLAKIFQQEFSDIQIEQRGQKFKNGSLSSEPEELYPNLLEISFPEKFYTAEISIDKAKIAEEINVYLESIGKEVVKNFKLRTLVNDALRKNKITHRDWILHENFLYTFRDLSNSSEPLLKVVDKGTITSVSCQNFYEESDDTSRVFKHLLRNTFMEFCKTKEIEWFNEDSIFRFSNNKLMPNKKQIRWKGKNESTKTVIFEMMNKKEGHIICYRNLAFRAEFEFLGDKWYIMLNPTWSFTNPYGYLKSKYEAGYMSGIKRMENNAAVCNYFRFFGYYLSYVDLFTTSYPYFNTHRSKTISFSPRLEEKTWKPIKVSDTNADGLDGELHVDNELNPTLFD